MVWKYNIIIDSVFGVGLSREIGGRYAEVVEWMNRQGAVKLAIDIPSGIDARSGQVLGVAFRADYTVTFQCEKLGCVLFPGAEYAGFVHVSDIGIDTSVFVKEEDVRRQMAENAKKPKKKSGFMARLEEMQRQQQQMLKEQQKQKGRR